MLFRPKKKTLMQILDEDELPHKGFVAAGQSWAALLVPSFEYVQLEKSRGCGGTPWQGGALSLKETPWLQPPRDKEEPRGRGGRGSRRSS